MYPVHVAVSAALFIVELGLAGWLAIWICRDLPTRVLALCQLLCGIAAMLSLLQTIPLMAPAQLGFELCFAIVLLRAAHSPALAEETVQVRRAGGS